jgi:hypothetical protein
MSNFASSTDKIRCPFCGREIDPFLFELHKIICMNMAKRTATGGGKK